MTTLPEEFREDTLLRNVAALTEVQPELALRLCLPVGDDHVRVAADGSLELRRHNLHVRLDLEVEALSEDRADQPPQRPEREAGAPRFVFGVGLGELVRHALDEDPEGEVVAWERDPWLLRLALMRRDFSAELERGRLRFLLGADVVEAPDEEQLSAPPLEHPLLERIYRHERDLLHQGRENCALLCTGGLFVDDLAASLKRRGWSIYGLDVERLAVEELDHCVASLQPRLVASINYTEGLAEFCGRHELPLLCWEIDPAAGGPRALGPEARGDARSDGRGPTIFTYREAMVAPWKRAGFARAEYLPLAADPAHRTPSSAAELEDERYRAPIALVGSSLVENAKRFERLFLAYCMRWSGDESAAGLAAARDLLQRVLEEQRADFTEYRVPELLERHAPGLAAAVHAGGAGHDAAILIGELAGAEKRLTLAAHLGPLGLRVWGDAEWQTLTRFGVRAMGPAGHRYELNRVYSGATVNLDIGRLYQSDIVTMRVFDALACGGFVLAEHSPALARLFEVGVELESYRTVPELIEKAQHFVAHPDEAAAIAERGRAAVLARHTIDRRVDHMLARVGVAA